MFGETLCRALLHGGSRFLFGGLTVLPECLLLCRDPQENTVIERTSRSTQQNAAGLSEILAGTPIQRLGLVTSAMHMRRSQRVFKHYFPGVTVVPIPVDFSYNPPDLRLKYFIPNGPSFDRSREALHEYIGLLWYRLRYGMATT